MSDALAAAAAERKRRRRRDRLERILFVVSPIVLIAVWELATWMKWVDTRLFPRPSLVIVELVEMVRSGELPKHVWDTLARIGAAFVLGAIGGVATGLAMGLSRWVRAALMPIVAAIYPLPKVAIFPL